MRTSREVYNLIRYHARFDPKRFVIGYESRLPEPREVAYTAFVPDGEIPWHRVLYFREGDTIVWDRRTRTDTLLAAAPAPPDAARTVPLADGDFFQPLPLHRFDRRAGAWTAVETVETAAHGGPSAGVTLATFNVLCDAFADTPTHLDRRIPSLIAELRTVDADVIALQEASPALLHALLAERWVREAYALSDGPMARTIDPYGVLLLTRLPVTQLVVHRFSRSKRALVAEVRAGGTALQVGVVHLTSDRSPNAAAVRRVQLDALLGALPVRGAGAPPVVLLGDFNWDDDELRATMAQAGFTDAWTATRPGDRGFTFDTARNALAAVTSSVQRSARLDRVFLRDGALALRPSGAELFATAAIDRSGELFPSDHFGVVVRARCTALDPTAPPTAVTSGPTHHTAVVLVPPADCWPQIQALRLRHDRHAARWMPHVTLLYGFVPEEAFEGARATIERALAEAQPFEVTLAALDTFTHRQSRTVWARPDVEPAGALHALQSALERAFPQCSEQGQKSPAGYTPHLSLAQLADGDPAADTLLGAWRAAWKPLRFTVRDVAIISRRGDEPFAVRHVVKLGGAPRVPERPCAPAIDPRDAPLATLLRDEDPPDGGAAAEAARQAAIAHLRDACIAALPGDHAAGALHLTGAVRLGVVEAGSDVDAVAVGPVAVPREAFFAAAAEWIEAASGEAWIVDDAIAPVLRGVVSGVAVDLGYAELPPDLESLPPEALSPADLARLDPASRGALLAVRDAACVRAAVAERGREGAFQLALRAIKRWARARGLYSNSFGFLSGFGWTLLAAWGASRADEPTAAAALDRAFAALAACDATHPVALTEEAAAYVPRSRDILLLPTPSAPSRNAARNVTRATAAVLRSEAVRAGDTVERARRGAAPWSALFAPYDVRAGSATWLRLSLSCADRRGLDASAGWIEGHALGLLLDLEDGAAPGLRPDPRRALVVGGSDGAEGIGWTVSLGEGAIDLDRVREAAARFEQAFAAWEGRPPGASLAIAL